MNILSTKGAQKTVQTSATNLSLNVTNQGDFQKVYQGYNNSFNKTAGLQKQASQKLLQSTRKTLWNDLGAALAVCEVLMAPAHKEWLIDALEYYDIPQVLDPAKANEFVPVLRLIMGFYPPKPSGWKVGDPEPAWDWSRNCESYAKVLRAAKHLKLDADGLIYKLNDDKGYTKLKKADDDRNLDGDEAHQEQIKRFKAIINDEPKIVIPADGFGIPAKDRPSLVALWATVSPDGALLNIQGKLPTSVASIEAHINRVSEKLYPDVMLRQKDREIAELKRLNAQQVNGVAVEGNVKVTNLGKSAGKSTEAAKA